MNIFLSPPSIPYVGSQPISVLVAAVLILGGGARTATMPASRLSSTVTLAEGLTLRTMSTNWLLVRSSPVLKILDFVAGTSQALAMRVDTHGHSPWHFTGQASLDLNAHFAILSTRANPITVANYPYVPKTHSGILIHPRA